MMHTFKAIHDDRSQKDAERAAEVARLEWLKVKKRHDSGCSEYPCEVKLKCPDASCPDHNAKPLKKTARACKECLRRGKLGEKNMEQERIAYLKAQEDADKEEAEKEARKKAIEQANKLSFIEEYQSKPPKGWCCEKYFCSVRFCAENPTCRCAGHCRIIKAWREERPDPEEVPLPETRSLEVIKDLYYRWRREVKDLHPRRQEAKKLRRTPDKDVSSLEQSSNSNRTSVSDLNTPPPDTPERNSNSNRTSMTDPNLPESPNTEPCDSYTASSTTDSSETRSSQVNSQYRNPASISTATGSSETEPGQVSSAEPEAPLIQQETIRNSTRNLSYRAKKFFKKCLRRQSSPPAP